MRRVYFGLLVSVMFLANFVEIALPKYTALYWQNDVFVNPPYQEFGPAPCVGTEFTITIEVYEATELYGFDIQFTWNPTWLEYVGYTVMVPVDEHPSGVLHPPTLRVKDVVDEDGNIPDADAETRCWVAEAAMLPAKTFNGNGTFFAMTFRIRKQPAIGEPDAKVALHIVSYSLALASGMSNSEAAAGPTGTIQPPPIDGTVVIHALVLTGPGDLNYDKRVDISDIVIAASIYGYSQGEPRWNPEADLAEPYGVIDIFD